MTRKFGRKINYIPLLISLVIGVCIGMVCYLISRDLLIGFIFGLLSIIITSSIISLNMANYKFNPNKPGIFQWQSVDDVFLMVVD